MRIEGLRFGDGTVVHLWQLTEDASQLRELCELAGVACDDVEGLAAKRQCEVMCERLLLAPLTDSALRHDEHGAPVVAGLHVSLSHTSDLVCVAVNGEHRVGADVERTDRQQVLRVRHKFLNENEQKLVAADDLAAHLAAWTAKEALIKLSGRRDIDWTNDIVLLSLTDDGGWAMCQGRPCELYRQRMGEHVVTLAVEADCAG